MKKEVVVITGASAGLGRALAHVFAKRGACIGLLARDQDRLNVTQKEVEELGGKSLAIPLDVSDAFQVEKAASKIEESLGPIDKWINNAMVSVFSPVYEMTAEEFKRVTEVTFLGSVYGTMTALKCMRPRNRGIIVQVGSALAYRGIPLQSAYCAAKHALRGFCESVRCELLHDKSDVKITMIQLPAINTPQFSWVKSRLPRKSQPIPPIFQPEPIADAIMWASDHYRREWIVGLSAVKVIIGNKIAPGFLDCFLAKKGYEGQQFNGPRDPNRPNNLFLPVRGDWNARGEFSDRAKSICIHFWLNKHRSVIAIIFVVFLILLYFYFI